MSLNKSQIAAVRDAFETLAYEAELDCYVRKARKLLARVGCSVKKDGPFVTLFSPRTGGHTLNMARGVRPVTDLMAHVEGFVEQNQIANDLDAWGKATGRGTLVAVEFVEAK